MLAEIGQVSEVFVHRVCGLSACCCFCAVYSGLISEGANRPVRFEHHHVPPSARSSNLDSGAPVLGSETDAVGVGPDAGCHRGTRACHHAKPVGRNAQHLQVALQKPIHSSRQKSPKSSATGKPALRAFFPIAYSIVHLDVFVPHHIGISQQQRRHLVGVRPKPHH